MNHSKMLTTRRRKQRAKKQLAKLAKQAKRLRNREATRAAGGAP